MSPRGDRLLPTVSVMVRPGISRPLATGAWCVRSEGVDMIADEMIDVQWETTTRHSARLTRGQVRELLGHDADKLARRPIIDEYLYPNEPDMDGSRYELAEALGRLETDSGTVETRMIILVEPQA